ncbi:MAG: hypothetical protein JRI25_12150 [Deltaproteobacteria bacterium]|nr:hypothetical protein [Deltaproteobacteria bacterium]MBW2255336.1 hypothetical protein [Deltaproteobacteria bacterium]
MRMALFALLVPGLAWADPCADLDGMPDGPVTAGLFNGDLLRAHRVCGRTEVGTFGSAYLVMDTDNFYGHIVASGFLDGSLAVDEDTEVFARLELARYDSVIAPFPDAYFGTGFTAVGVSRRVRTTDSSSLAVNGKVVLPTTGLYRNAWPFGFDAGLAAVYAGVSRIRVHAQLTAAFEVAAGAGPASPVLGVSPTVGAQWRPGRAFALVLDLTSSHGMTDEVDYVAGALALRFSDGKRFGMELGASVPFAGRERALATVDLRLSARVR